MKPASPRAARRLAKRAAQDTLSLDTLARRLDKARIKAVSPAFEARAKRLLASYLQTAATHGIPLRQVLRDLASGGAAARLADAVRNEIMKAPPEVVTNAACKTGCAFCCILTEENGGVITRAEAEEVHSALTAHAGTADGRSWHPKGCAALDPATRACRIYDSRPMICRSFISTNATACEENANGGTAGGAGLIGSHLDYLAIQALCRSILKGTAPVPTYSLARIAAEAVAGTDLALALKSAKHPPQTLDHAIMDAAKAAGQAPG